MRALLILDAALMALAATMALVLGVVCILYAANLELSPRLAGELPGLLALTGVFAALAVAAAIAVWSLRRRAAPWLVQPLFLLGVGAAGLWIWDFLQ